MPKQISLLEDVDTVGKVLHLIESTEMPVSVDFVARNLGLNWSTARALLMQLSLEGKLVAEKTTKSWIFSHKVEDGSVKRKREATVTWKRSSRASR